MIPNPRPSLMLCVKTIPVIMMYAGRAPAISFQSICVMDRIMMNPTMTNAGAVANPGMARKMGAQIRDMRKRRAATMAASPVLAPALTPMADSANVVVVLVPRMAPAKVAMESAIRTFLIPGMVPSFFIRGVLTTAPLTEPTVSKKSVKKKEKLISVREQ